MINDKVLRQLSELVIWGRIDKISLGHLRKAYGVETPVSADARLPETRTQLAVAELLLRLANGHAIPKNLGMEEAREFIHEALGIDPKNTNWEEYDS
jgi:hypothetical protein